MFSGANLEKKNQICNSLSKKNAIDELFFSFETVKPVIPKERSIVTSLPFCDIVCKLFKRLIESLAVKGAAVPTTRKFRIFGSFGKNTAETLHSESRRGDDVGG